MFKIAVLFVLTAATLATPAHAYVGPGSSLGAIGVFLGLIGTLILALVSFVWYPLKRLLRRLREKHSAAGKNPE